MINSQSNSFVSPIFIETNNKMKKFALHSADAFIKGTPLEGVSWSNACRLFLDTLEKIIPNHLLSINLDPFHSAIAQRERINSHETLSLAANDLRISIHNLKVDEEIWIPTHLVDSENKQGMMLGFKRASSKRFEVLTINCGEGIECHPSIIINGEKKFQSCLVSKGVPANRLCENDFLENLLEVVCFSKWCENPKPLLWYQVFLPYLGGTIDRSNQSYETIPRSGINEVNTLFSLLRYQLQSDLHSYKRIKLFYRQEHLKQASEQIKQHPDRSFIYLIRGVMKQQAKSLAKAWKKWGLNREPEKVAPITQELTEIGRQSKEIKKQLNCCKEIPHLPLSGQCVEEVSYLDLFSNPPMDFFSANRKVTPYQGPHYTIPKQKEPPCPLDKIVAKNSSSVEISYWLRQVYCSFSHWPSIFDPSWDNIPQNQLENWIVGFSQVETREIAYFYMLAMIEKLAFRHPLLKEKLIGHKLYSRTQLAYFAFSSNQSFTSPQEQKKLLELLEYYGLKNYDPAREDAEFLQKLDANVAIDISSDHLFLGPFFNTNTQRFLSQFPGLSSTKRMSNFLTGKEHHSPLLEALYIAAYNINYFEYQSRFNPVEGKKFDFGFNSPLHIGGVHWLTNSMPRYRDPKKDIENLYTISLKHDELIFYPQNKLIALQKDHLSNFQLSCSSYDRIARAIAHINQDPLQAEPSKSWRNIDLLTQYFFQGPILLKTLLQEPQTAIELMHMIHNQLKLNQNNELEWDQQLFENYLMYACLGEQLKAHIEYAMHEAPEKYAPFAEELNPLLISFAQHLRNAILPQCSHENKKEVLSWLNRLYPHTLHKDNFAQYACDQLLFKLFSIYNSESLGEILTHLNKDKNLKNSVLQQIFLSITRIDTGAQEWEIDEVNANKVTCGKYTIDFFNAKLLEDDYVLEQFFPLAIKNRLLGEKLISPEDPIEKKSANHFLIHASPRPIHIEVNGQKTKLICQIDGRDYALCASPSHFKTDRLWRSLDEQVPSHYLLEKSTNTTLFIFEDGSASDTLQGSCKLVGIPTSPFGSFATEEHILAWKEAGSLQNVDKLKLPTGLEFHVHNDKMSSPAFPGFTVVDGSYWKKKLGLDHLIVLENIEGEQKILLRTGSLYALSNGLEKVFDPDVRPGTLSDWNYCLLDIVKKPYRKPFLQGTSPKDQLHFIHQLFLKKRYSQAQAYLKELNFVKGLDTESQKILETLLHLHDEHPDAILLKLRFALQLAKNLIFYQHNEWENVQKLIKLSFYPTYLQQLGTHGLEPLTREEELDLIRLTQEKSPQLVERIRFLNGKKSSLKSGLSSLKFLALEICLVAKEIFTFKKEKTPHWKTHILGPIDTHSDEEFNKIYQIARYGNKREREKLRRKIQLTNPDEQDLFKCSLIKCLLAFPRIFSCLIYFNGPQPGNPRGFFNEIKYCIGIMKRTPAYLFFLAYTLINHSTARSSVYEFAHKGLDESLSTTLKTELPRPIESLQAACLPINADLFSSGHQENMEDILSELNTYPEDALTLIQRLGEQIKPINREDAYKLFLNGRSESYRTANPFLSDDKIKEIDSRVACFLVQQNPDIHHVRAYDSTYPSECIRAYLVFEYRNQLFLRPGQVESLKNIWEEKNSPAIVSKQGTGSGKSKIQFPLLQYLFQTVRSTFNIWPKSLFPTNRDDIQREVAQSLNQKAEAFSFNRQIPKDDETLMSINRTLYQAVKEKRQLSTTAEDIQSVELTFIEALFDMSHGTKKADPKLFYALKKMLQLFKNMKHLVDESQIVQSSKKELNFSIGTPQAESSQLIACMGDIISCLASPEIDALLQLKTNQQHLITSADIAKIIELLAEKMAKKLKVKSDHLAEFKNYILKEEVSAPAWISERADREHFALLRGVSCHLLKECFENRCLGVNYGSPDPSKLKGYAIPYASNNSPVKDSEFDNTFETLLKTFHIYLYKTLNNEQSWELIQWMRTHATNEALARGIKLEKTHYYKQFEKMRPANLPALFDVLPNDPHLEILGNNDLFIRDYVKYFVATEVKKYPKKIKSTPQNLRSQFANMVTMSATPIDPQLYAPSNIFYDDPNRSDEKVEEKIRTSCQNPDSIHLIDSKTPQEILSSLLSLLNASRMQNQEFRMLIDTGALLKGLSNLEVAQQCLEKLDPAIQGILFFDSQDEMVILERGTNQPVPFHQSQLQPSQLFTYCDHKHIFGADTKQIPEAIALCTLDKQTSYEEMIQGVGRLRQIMQNQTPQFALTTDFNAKIADAEGQVANIDQLIATAKHNSLLEKEELIYRSLKQQMHNEIRSRVMEALLSAPSLHEALNIFKQTESILIENQDATVWDMYGNPMQTVDRHTSLLRYQQKCMACAKRLSIFNAADRSQLVSVIESYKSRILEYPFTTKIKEGLFSCDSHSEIQQEIQKEVQVEKIVHSQKAKPSFVPRRAAAWPDHLNFYKDDWIKVSNLAKSIFRSLMGKLEIVQHKITRGLIHFGETVFNNDLLLIITGVFSVSILSGPLAFYPLLLLKTVVVLAAGSYVIHRGFKKIKQRYFTYPVELYALDQIIGRDTRPGINRMRQFFAPRVTTQILATSNYLPVKDTVPFTLFGPEQKFACNLLIVKEKNQMTAIIGDQTTDVTSWKERLPRLEKQNLQAERQIFVYDLALDVITLEGSKITTAEELENDEEFQKIVLKIKLLNGRNNFTKKQFSLLKMLINNKEKADALSKFIQEIHVNHPEKNKEFSTSALASFLTFKSGGG